MTAKAKQFDFPVAIRWLAGRRTVASVPGKDDLYVATPPEFKGGVEGVWSPEDLLVGSIASCYAVTLLSIAERREVPVRALDVAGRGRVSQRKDGRFGFVEAVLRVGFETEPGFEAEAEAVADAAEQGCLVSASLDFPIRLEVEIRVAPLAGASL